MDYLKIEKKWRKKWEEEKADSFDVTRADKKKYVLEMFSYPSGANLHLGHWYNFGLTDVYARLLRMQGFEVFHPMGFDAFGLPAENYAIKTGIHPKDSTEKNIATMERQLKDMGASFDWDYEIKTCDPKYYKWTQWLFLQLYKHGLAEEKLAPVNWCPSCNTVIANEQVVDGCCERCGAVVERREMRQWFLKITKYAEELLSGLDKIDWPEKTKLMQRNWIGKSYGGTVTFDLERGGSFDVFTTRADTLFGCSYVVLAPEHPLVGEITTAEQKDAVAEYKAQAARQSEIDRTSTVKEKTGVFTGAYAINPVNGEKVPVWVADYVLATYGTGAVMAVPAHDTRDYEFATKFGLPIKRVVKSADGSPDDLPFTEYGVNVDSGFATGMKTEDAKHAILAELAKKGKGGEKVTYRLRDWSVSRQRYWGAPIPMIHCEKCGVVPVPEKDLPVELPYDVDFRPKGTSPLGGNEDYMNCTCPKCGGPARRDPDTLDTFVCSSWYYLRYPNAKNDEKAFDTAWTDKLLPVDVYVGGAEHACMHLLYSRFVTKALRDMGYIRFDEPFMRLVHQGVILGPDGKRMSKTRGNIINPDDYVSVYGSDVFRMYLCFAFSYTEGGPFQADGIPAIAKYLDRVDRICRKAFEGKGKPAADKAKAAELEYAENYAAKCCGADIAAFSFNTAVARLMELTNAMYKYDEADDVLYRAALTLIKLMAPITPHISEELWEAAGNTESVLRQPYPTADESKLVRSEVEIPVQLMGKLKGKVMLAPDAPESDALAAALSLLGIPEARKIIYRPGKIINIIA
ncbi:MAG TPA: leucine--tRNA ligase [Candidatus Protoclostridium stercorigallinarum]|uniref:Leucine--tRNA ligase n=1 Tax=Candidatus Protoclostridium stercorigallinarum TaxID=2838741 RepID=A0A9D1TSZ8_9FIRM|nr:leucine--tRNA ligase [Candidatus Protoclostridium stercorigallinarum]